MSTIYTTPANAIDRSISETTVTRYTGSLAELLEYAHEEGYETDSAVENNGDIDVWGWTDATLDDEQDWRVLVIDPERLR